MTGRWRALGAGLAVLVNLVALYVPRAPSVPTAGLPLDKLVHVVVFALPVVALVRAGCPRRPVIGLLVLNAVVSEVIQGTLLANRSGDPWDLAADLVGIALGAWLVRPRPERSAVGTSAGS